MFQEMNRAHYFMRVTSVRTKDKFDARMRVTVKDLIRYIYAKESQPIEESSPQREFTWHLETAEKLGDLFFRVDSSSQRQFLKNVAEWNRNRPVRICDYVQKLADIFPPEHLTRLLLSSLKNTPEEIISIYEANKGEAKSSDYSGYPTGIDSSKLKSIATIVRVL